MQKKYIATSFHSCVLIKSNFLVIVKHFYLPSLFGLYGEHWHILQEIRFLLKTFMQLGVGGGRGGEGGD